MTTPSPKSTPSRTNSNIIVKNYSNIPTRTNTAPQSYYDNGASLNNVSTENDPVLMRVLQVKRVQMALVNRGYYSGKIDGDLGKNTRKAIANFQVDKNLTINGRMTTELLNSLGVLAVNYSEE
ncbi:peptidoglycan-binding protein [Acinetobacter nosocomialis]|uniref:peptidoglycan-binding protein n=1 Tax=Acinetobacter nosocomialis TaxID=106654 RepID=UPI001D18775C|nr:peptidoglycan-binding protein [Acinetobacter nosocomialis]